MKHFRTYDFGRYIGAETSPPQFPQSPATLTFRIDGKQAGKGRIGRSVPAGFTLSETFDIGIDFGSPVSLDYFERAPFSFNGAVEKVQFRYIRA